jgi:hypothetical protein
VILKYIFVFYTFFLLLLCSSCRNWIVNLSADERSVKICSAAAGHNNDKKIIPAAFSLRHE